MLFGSVRCCRSSVAAVAYRMSCASTLGVRMAAAMRVPVSMLAAARIVPVSAAMGMLTARITAVSSNMGMLTVRPCSVLGTVVMLATRAPLVRAAGCSVSPIGASLGPVPPGAAPFVAVSSLDLDPRLMTVSLASGIGAPLFVTALLALRLGVTLVVVALSAFSAISASLVAVITAFGANAAFFVPLDVGVALDVRIPGLGGVVGPLALLGEPSPELCRALSLLALLVVLAVGLPVVFAVILAAVFTVVLAAAMGSRFFPGVRFLAAAIEAPTAGARSEGYVVLHPVSHQRRHLLWPRLGPPGRLRRWR